MTKRDREAVWSAINRCRCALCRNARDVAWIETGASPTSDMAERIALAIATARAEGAAEERERAANVCRRCGGRGIVPASEHGRRPAPRIVCPSCGGRVVR